MHDQALTKLLGHYWEHEGLALWEKTKEDRIVEDETGLSIRLTGRSVSFTGIPGEGIHIPMLDREMCTFFLPRPKWEALIRHVQKSAFHDEDSAKVYLLNRILEAVYVKPRRSSNTARVVCFALLLTVLMFALIAWDPVRPALVVLAALLLGGAVLLLGFSARGRDDKAISIFSDCVSSEVDRALEAALAALEKPDVSRAKGWLAGGMLICSAACAWVAMQPEYFLMLPAQRVDYFFSEYIHGFMEEAEDALMWMTPGKAKTVLTEKIDEDDKGSYDSIHAAQLAVRLHEKGRFSQEDAREVVQRGLDNFEPQFGSLAYHLEELEEIIPVCTPEFMCSFVQKHCGQKDIEESVLKTLGAGTKNASIEDRMACYDALMKSGHDGAVYLNSALETAETVAEARELLLQMPEKHRKSIAEAWSMSFADQDSKLEYLHMLASVGIRMGADFLTPVKLEWDMSKFRISAEAENRLPEGNYTILPVLRTESRESITGYFMEDGTSDADLKRMPGYSVHDEDNRSAQSLELLPQVLAALSAERIPRSVEEADLILLFDQQYQLHSSIELQAYNIASERGVRNKPVFQAVQRLGVYDAETGARLLLINERLELPIEMYSSTREKVFRETWDKDVYEYISHYFIVNFSKLWVDQQLTQVCETLQTSGGNLSAFLMAEE